MLRGNYAAKIDDKGRLKIPNAFRALVEKTHGAELFVTSLTGESVRVYPMPVWLALEDKLARAPSTHPARIKYGDRVELVHADYRELDRVLDARGISQVAGILADLGVSSMQFDADGRGFSFRRDEPLDMRMDQSQGPSVAELLRDVDETELADVIYRFGEERASRRVARAIVHARRESPIETTGRLGAVVRRAVPHKGHQRIDPATRPFQALRIWVNRQLDGLDSFLAHAARRLLAGARLAVITFPSLEDRIVKHTFRAMAQAGEGLRILTKRPLVPSDEEVARNPRARSAKLRAIERFA